MIRNLSITLVVICLLSIASPVMAQSETPTETEITNDQIMDWYNSEADLSDEDAKRALDYYNNNYEEFDSEVRGSVSLYLEGEVNEAETSTQEPTATPQETDQSDVSKDDFLQYAREGQDVSKDEARSLYSTYTDNIGRFDADERELVENWLKDQIAGRESEATGTGLDERSFQFVEDDGSNNTETETYQPALEAINDSQVTGSELPDVFDYRGERVLPGLRLEYEEWSGNHTTLILVADRDMTVSLNDAWLASSDIDRAAPRYEVDLQQGHNVVQVRTLADNQGEEYLAVSSTDYVNTITNPYEPFIDRIQKRHIPAIVGGSVLGFVSLFVLFASSRKNKYKGRFVHIDKVLNRI